MCGLAACDAAVEEEDVASDDAALAALEQEIGFDGAVSRLDETALGRVDDEATSLATRGVDPASLERTITRSVLREARARRAAPSPGIAPRTAYDIDLLQLNGEEQTLCRRARLVCVRVLLAGFRARGASQVEYDDGNVGGRIDAFRHTYWNALMASSVGVTHAKAWGDAHENGYPSNRATTANRILSDMDFHNNAQGRAIGAAGGDAKAKVRAALETGSLRAVRYDLDEADGVLVPSNQCTAEVRCGR
jgi:hypothetical protein